MRKNKIAVLALVLMSAMGVSCSRIGAPSDAAITTDIKAKMFSEPALKAAAVDVVSKHGEVTLTGQVPNDAARLAAYKIATETKQQSARQEGKSRLRQKDLDNLRLIRRRWWPWLLRRHQHLLHRHSR